MEGNATKIFNCPLRCIYHGARRPDGAFCDSTYGGQEQTFCIGENYCKIADTFKEYQTKLDEAVKRAEALEAAQKSSG